MINIRTHEDFFNVIRNNVLTGELLEQLTKRLPGWPGFRDVFTVSALKGRGVADLRGYLFDFAEEAPWQFHPDLKTDLDPRDLVTKVVKSKLLEVLPKEAPYLLQPEIASWKIENGVLRLNITINSSKPRLTGLLLYHGASNLKTVSQLTEHDLQNFFGREVFVLLSVNTTHAPVSTNKMKNLISDQPVPF